MDVSKYFSVLIKYFDTTLPANTEGHCCRSERDIELLDESRSPSVLAGDSLSMTYRQAFYGIMA